MKVGDILEKEGIEYKRFYFRGHYCGVSEDFPHVDGYYDTVRYGKLESFETGSEVVGEWVMVWECLTMGDAHVPSSYTAYYVRRDDYMKALELLRRELTGWRREYIKEVMISEVEQEKKRLQEIIKRELCNLDIVTLSDILDLIRKTQR